VSDESTQVFANITHLSISNITGNFHHKISYKEANKEQHTSAKSAKSSWAGFGDN